MAKPTPPHLEQLRSLAGQPDEQAHFAVTLLNPRLGVQVIMAALHVLRTDPPPTARPPLLTLYDHYDQKNSTRDPAANLRAAILRNLRTLVLSEDAPFLARAAATYVFPPPAFKEEGAQLRSAALNALAEVDETLARFHAVRLLANEHTDPMSGEPALTAARLLAAHHEVTTLYFYVTQDGARTAPEVLSECLRHLTSLPESMVAGLVERYGASEHEIVLVGLIDLLIHHRSGPQGVDYLAGFLQGATQLDAYRYLATVMLTSGRAALIDLLLTAARNERQRERAAILVDVLSLLQDAPDVAPIVAELRRKLGQSQFDRPAARRA